MRSAFTVLYPREAMSRMETSLHVCTRLCQRTAPARRSHPSARAHASGASRGCRSNSPARAPTLHASYGTNHAQHRWRPCRGQDALWTRILLSSTTYTRQAVARDATLEAGGRAGAPPVSLPKAMSAEPSATATCPGPRHTTLQPVATCLDAVRFAVHQPSSAEAEGCLALANK